MTTYTNNLAHLIGKELKILSERTKFNKRQRMIDFNKKNIQQLFFI